MASGDGGRSAASGRNATTQAKRPRPAVCLASPTFGSPAQRQGGGNAAELGKESGDPEHVRARDDDVDGGASGSTLPHRTRIAQGENPMSDARDQRRLAASSS